MRNACRPRGPLQHLDHDARALVGDPMPVATQAGDVQENVRHPVVGHDEAVAPGGVKPLDDAGHLDDARCLVANLDTNTAVNAGTAAHLLGCNSDTGHDVPAPLFNRGTFRGAVPNFN
jgi:hypothetical protein